MNKGELVDKIAEKADVSKKEADAIMMATIDSIMEAVSEGIALRIDVRTLFEGSINTIAKVIKFVPALTHPILERKPPMLNLVEVWRIRRQVPKFTSCLSHQFLDHLGMVKTGIVHHNDITRLQLRQQALR
jgi:hypothetical protein